MLYTYHFLFNILHVIPKQFIEFLKMEIDKLNCIWKCKSPIIDKEILKKKCNWRCYTIRFSVIFYVILIKAVQCWRMNRKQTYRIKQTSERNPHIWVSFTYMNNWFIPKLAAAQRGKDLFLVYCTVSTGYLHGSTREGKTGIALFLKIWIWLSWYVYLGRFFGILKVCTLVCVCAKHCKSALVKENSGIGIEVLYHSNTIPSLTGCFDKILLYM